MKAALDSPKLLRLLRRNLQNECGPALHVRFERFPIEPDVTASCRATAASERWGVGAEATQSSAWKQTSKNVYMASTRKSPLKTGFP
jgi:hypothetical protein